MSNMNKQTSIKNRLKEKAAEVTTKFLIHQAEEGITYSIPFAMSEATYPIELMKEDME